MDKIDFKKLYKQFYNPTTKEFTLVDVPAMQFLMVDGKGRPEGKDYQDAVSALYPVAYKLKFTSKIELGRDYVVPPLQGLWWADDWSAFVRNDRDEWQWTMMILQPEWITNEIYQTTLDEVMEAKDLPALSKMRLETYHEGLAVQIMHIGPYSDEAPTLAKLHNEYLPENGLTETGKHHEIYISDPRKVAPEKLKTVLRQPVKQVE